MDPVGKPTLTSNIAHRDLTRLKWNSVCVSEVDHVSG